MASSMPRLVSPRTAETLEMVKTVGGTFDADMWHVVAERDTALIADEIAHGMVSPIFVYQFDIGGKTPVAGISTKGMQHLATQYGGLRHKLISSIEKRGTVLTYQRYEAVTGTPIGVIALPPELASEADYYAVTVEVNDIKTGNSVQVERREYRFESRRDGSQYERPNFQTIAQSKARRNGYGVLLPQEMQAEFLNRNLKGDAHKVNLTSSLIDEKRSNVLRFAAAKGIALDRRRLEVLTFDQLSGIGDAAREGALPAFAHAAVALGLTAGENTTDAEPEPQRAEPPRRRAGRSQTRETVEPPAPTPEPEQPPTEPPATPPRGSGIRFEE